MSMPNLNRESVRLAGDQCNVDITRGPPAVPSAISTSGGQLPPFGYSRKAYPIPHARSNFTRTVHLPCAAEKPLAPETPPARQSVPPALYVRNTIEPFAVKTFAASYSDSAPIEFVELSYLPHLVTSSGPLKSSTKSRVHPWK